MSAPSPSSVRFQYRTRLAALLLPVALTVVGCSDDDKSAVTDGSSTSDAASDGGTSDAAPAVVTFDEVAPILADKCVRCHHDGGIAPFRLDSYEMAVQKGALAKVAITTGLMPPYYIHHDGTCGDFAATEALTATEQATLVAWIDGGMHAGTGGSAVGPATPSATLTNPQEMKTPKFMPAPLGTQVAKDDDYRCFLMDPAVTTDKFITGYEVEPGNATIVHHVLGFVVDPNKMTKNGKTNAAVMQELDAKSPDIIGWDCFGGAGDGIEEESVPVDWAPGQGAVPYPAKMGVPIKAGSKVVVQIHYNLADPKNVGMMDSTAVRLQYADAVDRKLVFMLPDAFLESLYAKDMPDSLAPGQKLIPYSWTKSAEMLGLAAPLPYADLIAVMPHMHQRGTGLELRLAPDKTTPATCTAKTDRWDFHWQKMYFYKTPPRLTPASQISVTCDYDTSADKTPVMPGWGTKNEMCLTVLMLALPPGM